MNPDIAPNVISIIFHQLMYGRYDAKTESAPESESEEDEKKKTDETVARKHPAEIAAENMTVPEGFHVDVIAAEPDLLQPIAFTIDERGRMWVVEGHTYPRRAPEGQGKDRILIFEDTDNPFPHFITW